MIEVLGWFLIVIISLLSIVGAIVGYLVWLMYTGNRQAKQKTIDREPWSW